MCAAPIRAAALLLALTLAAFTDAAAIEIPPAPSGRVSDYAGILTPADRARLGSALEEFERETTNQLAVAIFRSLEGEDPEDFTSRLFARWNLGQAGRNNGLLLAIYLEDRKARIEVGYGLEGVLPDLTAITILREELTPRFRKGDYAGGVLATCQAIMAATRGEYRAPARGHEGLPLGVTLFLLFFGGWFLSFLLRNARGATLGARGRRRVYRSGPFYWGGGGGWGGSGGGGGWGGGGGFSGGGGMSGGGGATGSW